MMGRRWWRTWKRANTSFIVALTFAAVLLPLDMAFWDDAPLFSHVRFLPAGFFVKSLVVLFLVNALWIDVFLAWKTRSDLRIRPGARLLRLTLGSVPLLGFYAINLWQDILIHKPRWAVDEATPGRPATGRFYRLAAQLLNRSRALSFSMLLWIYAGNALFLVALSAWLNQARQLGAAAFGADTFQVTLHVIVCCGLMDSVRGEIRRHVVLGWRRMVLWMLPWLALPLPFPFAFIAVGAVTVSNTYSTRQRTLCWATRFNGDGIERLATWGHLQEVLDKSPGVLRHRLRAEGVGRSQRPGRIGHRLTAFYRLKTFLLGIDTLALGWLAGHLAGHDPGLNIVIGSLVFLCTLLALVGAGSAWLLAVTRTFLRSIGPPQRPTFLEVHAYGSLLATGLLIAATGLNVGLWLRQGNTPQAACLMMLLAVLIVGVGNLAMLLRLILKKFDGHQEDHYEDIVWLVFFLALMLASGLMAIDEDAARIGTSVLQAMAFLLPLWHLALVAVFWRDWHQQRPGRQSPVLTASLVLPLGGLAVPLWIVSDHRLRACEEPKP